jgi:hypothetical protein
VNASPVASAAEARAPRGRALCRTCRHFAGVGPEIEERLPGLPALGSVYGSVRAADGLCRVHDRYLAAASSCAAHAPEQPRLPRR